MKPHRAVSPVQLQTQDAAITSLSNGIVLDHPSGSCKPSSADEELTTKIKEAARYHDITVLDHIIVTGEGYYSFADEGLL